MIPGSDRWGVLDSKGAATDVLGADAATLADVITGVSQVSTPGTGTNTTQFVFKNSAGVAISSVRVMEGYMSDINGAPVTAITSWAAATNGYVDPLVTGKIHNLITTPAGLLGILFTGTATTRYCTFALPNGKLLISSALVFN